VICGLKASGLPRLSSTRSFLQLSLQERTYAAKNPTALLGHEKFLNVKEAHTSRLNRGYQAGGAEINFSFTKFVK
jgi:hypothetical protein